jgi:hypothetical protein
LGGARCAAQPGRVGSFVLNGDPTVKQIGIGLKKLTITGG